MPSNYSARQSGNRSGVMGITGIPDVAPIMYDGKEINTIHDLINSFKLDTYNEAKRKQELARSDPENFIPPAKEIDDDYWELIA